MGSGRITRVAMIVLSVIGLGVASYLTYVHYSGAQILCTAGDPCETVQTSVYSKLAGVPVALLGLIGYVLILASLLIPESERSRLGTLVLTAGGFGFSAYLTGRELFSIHAICVWCVSSAGLMTILFLLSIHRFLSGGSTRPEEPWPVEDEPAEASSARPDADALGAGA